MTADITKNDITALKRACIMALASKTVDASEAWAIRRAMDKLHKQFPNCGWDIEPTASA